MSVIRNARVFVVGIIQMEQRAGFDVFLVQVFHLGTILELQSQELTIYTDLAVRSHNMRQQIVAAIFLNLDDNCISCHSSKRRLLARSSNADLSGRTLQYSMRRIVVYSK
jgi:hypothetical protein